MKLNFGTFALTFSTLCAFAACPHVTQAQQFSTVDEAVAHANDWFTKDPSPQRGAVVLAVRPDVEVRGSVDVVFRYRTGGSNYGRFVGNSAWLQFVRPSELSLRIRVPNNHEIKRDLSIEAGEVLVVDDLAPDPIRPEDAVEVIGMVKLEGDADPDGIPISVDHVTTRTDEHGRFSLSGIGAGEIVVRASANGHIGLYQKVQVDRGRKPFVLLEGWRKRRALVHWAYQPDGSRNLSSNLETGRAIVDDRDMDRISFKEGFALVQGKSDFLVVQEKDRLIIRNFDQGSGRLGILKIPEIEFDEIRKAPDVPFPSRDLDLHEGAVYVFRCYDGEHFAKMEVLQIADNDDDYARLVAEMARE